MSGSNGFAKPTRRRSARSLLIRLILSSAAAALPPSPADAADATLAPTPIASQAVDLPVDSRVDLPADLPAPTNGQIDLSNVDSAAANSDAAVEPTPTAAADAAPPTTSPVTNGRPTVRVRRTDTPPTIDGVLDDAAWQDAAVITEFRQVSPVEGADPSERTEARITYDQDALYIAVRCFDSEPDRILGRQLQKDGSLGADDAISIGIDPYFDRRNGYLFETSPAGARRDGLIEQGGNVRLEWDGIWKVKTKIDELGWVAEIAIPTKTITFNPDAPAWGFNVGRVIRRKQETVRWAGLRSSLGVRNVGEAGNLEGIDGLSRGMGITIKPFLVGRVDMDDGQAELVPGGDVFFRVTSSTTAALTLNTDFAEVEVDERRVNLTRFPLFFPEKRDFFLQDAGIFAFGGVVSSPLAFQSRRIGIVDGETKDILAGVKLTGREGITNFGVLNVQMTDDDVLGSKNLSVARMSFNVLEQSSVGVIGTIGDPDSVSNDAYTAGVDYNYRNDSIGVNGDRTLVSNAYLMNTQSSDDQLASDFAWGCSLSYPNDVWSWSLNAEQAGARLDPALGFVSRPGVTEYDASIGRDFKPHQPVFYDVSVSTYLHVATDLSSDLVGYNYTPLSVQATNRIGDGVNGSWEINSDQLDEPFEIWPDVTIPQGQYTFGGPNFGAFTSGVRPLAGSVWVSPQTFYDGNRTDYSFSLTWRPGPHFRGAADYIINDVRLDEGDFRVYITRVRADVYFSPQLSWQNLVQWDNRSELIGINSRIRYEYDPGQDLFVVLNQGYDISQNSLDSTVSELTVKIGLTFRF